MTTPLSSPSAPPLLFLDVDGTLLPIGGPGRAPVTDWDGWQSSGNPRLATLTPAHGPRLLALGCELMWATAWMQEANEVIAPLLGLPRVPVVDLPEWESDLAPDGLHWKTRALVRTAAGRPFVWLDDELTERDRDWVAAHHPGPALLVKVVAAHGLTEADLAEVEAWVRGCQDPAGADLPAPRVPSVRLPTPEK